MTGEAAARAVAAALLATLLAGCGGGAANAPADGPADSLSMDEAVSTAKGHLLARSALPRLAGDTSVLDLDDIAGEVTDPVVEQRLDADGFVVGVRRDLRGRARDVTGADSRVLVFADAGGADSFVRSVADDPDPWFGSPSQAREIDIGDARGVLVKPPLCACAGAQPVYAALVAEGNRVLWLQVTGPRTTADTARNLLGSVLHS